MLALGHAATKKVARECWHLADKVFGELNLYCSAGKVLAKQGAAGVDRQTVEDFGEHEREELQRLQAELRQGSYAPAAVRRAWIPKPGGSEKRPLGIPRSETGSYKRRWST